MRGIEWHDYLCCLIALKPLELFLYCKFGRRVRYKLRSFITVFIPTRPSWPNTSFLPSYKTTTSQKIIRMYESSFLLLRLLLLNSTPYLNVTSMLLLFLTMSAFVWDYFGK